MNATNEASLVRFGFGQNWQSFSELIDTDRVAAALNSLRTMLNVTDLEGKTFLDVGCGSGLFSLAARRLGARVHSFDYDINSVECARNLKEKYFPEDTDWEVRQGSILDASIASLGKFDVVYAWGVLHHTGAMWRAMESVCTLVAPKGQLFIAIYNDQGWQSRGWRAVKQIYNQLPKSVNWILAVPLYLGLSVKAAFSQTSNVAARGMSRWHDVVDWVGGYPFEVASADRITGFLETRGFRVEKTKLTARLGCNEFVVRAPA